jgi:hypothetical protein
MRRKRERAWLVAIGVMGIAFVAVPRGVVAWIVLGAILVLAGFLVLTGRLRSPLDRLPRR